MGKAEGNPEGVNDRKVYKSTLKSEYGFTDRTIKALGPPDDLVKNPHYKSGPPASLYLLSRALRYKESNPDEFDETRRAKAKSAAQKAVATKVAKLDQLLDDNPLQLVRPLPESYDVLCKRAWDHACERYSNPIEPGFRAVIATVRHEFTNYHTVLSLIEGRCGSHDAYDGIRGALDRMIEGMIYDRYPELAQSGG